MFLKWILNEMNAESYEHTHTKYQKKKKKSGSVQISGQDNLVSAYWAK